MERTRYLTMRCIKSFRKWQLEYPRSFKATTLKCPIAAEPDVQGLWVVSIMLVPVHNIEDRTDDIQTYRPIDTQGSA